jgi:peptide/nickel transport system permease protein
MFVFILKRLASAVVLIVVVSLLSFVLTWITPGDPARAILGETATASQVAAKRAALGLDQNVFSAYAKWVGNALQGNLGASWFTNRPVSETIFARLPVTVSIAVVAIIVAGVIGTALGLWAAARRGAVDKVIGPLAVVGFALPNFIVAIALVTAFALNLHLFPATGWINFTDDPGGWLRSITLPVIALSIAATAAVAQQMRNAAIATLEQDFVRTLRGRGLSGRSIYFKHVLRNSAPVALTVLSLQFIGLLSGAVIIEYIFGLPGVGAMTVGAVTQHDQPLIQGAVITIVVVVVIVNLLLDLAYTWLNPKVRS